MKRNGLWLIVALVLGSLSARADNPCIDTNYWTTNCLTNAALTFTSITGSPWYSGAPEGYLVDCACGTISASADYSVANSILQRWKWHTALNGICTNWMEPNPEYKDGGPPAHTNTSYEVWAWDWYWGDYLLVTYGSGTNVSFSLDYATDGWIDFGVWGDVAPDHPCHDRPVKGDYIGTNFIVVKPRIVAPARDPDPPSPPVQNNYTFDKTPDPSGTCVVSVEGYSGVTVEDPKLVWTLEPIETSGLTSNPNPPMGPSVTFTYTRLPVANAYFGRKALTLTHPKGCSDTFYVDIFFDGDDDALNHPSSGSGVTPNWYYYWNQTDAYYSPTIYYNPTFIESNPAWDGALGVCAYVAGAWRCYMHSSANDGPYRIYEGPDFANGKQWKGVFIDGIDLYADVRRHESRHAYLWNWWFPYGHLPAGVAMEGDLDGDFLPDGLEPYLTAYGGPFDPSNTDSDGDQEVDGHDYVYWSQWFWNIGSADSQDWSHYQFSHQYYDF